MSTPWTAAPLGELCSVTAGGTPSRANQGYWHGDIPWVKISDMLQGAITDTEESISRLGLENSAAKMLPKGTLLLSIFATIGRTAVLEIDAATNQAIVGLVVRDPCRLDVNYLRRFLELKSAELKSQARGVAQANINGAILKRLGVPIPPLPEQRRIADVLDRVEALSAKRRAALAQLDTLTQAIFLDMFGDPSCNPKNWTRALMSEVGVGKYAVKAGPFGSSLKKSDYTAGGYRVYGQEQVIAGRFDVGDYYVGERKYQQLKTCAVAEGDVLVSLVGSFGKVLIVPSGIEPGIINPRLLKITPNQRLITPLFLAKLLGLPATQAAFTDLSHGGTMGILNAGQLKQLPVILPPMALQLLFAKRTAAVEFLQEIQRTALSGLDVLFASLQQLAFRGDL